MVAKTDDNIHLEIIKQFYFNDDSHSENEFVIETKFQRIAK